MRTITIGGYPLALSLSLALELSLVESATPLYRESRRDMDNGNGISDYDSRVLHYYCSMLSPSVARCSLACTRSLAQHQYAISTGGVPRAEEPGGGHGACSPSPVIVRFKDDPRGH